MLFIIRPRHNDEGGSFVKIIVGQKVYLQKFIMAFMEQEFNAIPAVIYVEFIERYPVHFARGAQDILRFDYCFEGEEAVKFLKECDYIFDYEEYLQKSEQELRSMIDSLLKGIDDKVAFYEANDEAYRTEHADELRDFFDQTRLKCEQLKFLIACKKGKLEYPELPEGAKVAKPTKRRRGLLGLFRRE